MNPLTDFVNVTNVAVEMQRVDTVTTLQCFRVKQPRIIGLHPFELVPTVHIAICLLSSAVSAGSENSNLPSKGHLPLHSHSFPTRVTV